MYVIPNHRAMVGNHQRDRHLAIIAVLAALAGAVVLLSSSAAARAAETSAATFLQAAAQTDIAEVNAGNLAQKNSENSDVKNFGQMLVADHGKHLTAVGDLAKSMGISVPDQPPAAEKAEADKLKKLTGRAFDQEFVNHMVEGHKLAITAYEAEAKAGNADTSALAQKTLPALQHHLETAEALLKTLGQQTAN
jgi:putative membrane protein